MPPSFLKESGTDNVEERCQFQGNEEEGAKPESAFDAFCSLLPCKVTVKCLMYSVLLVALILSLVVALAVVASRNCELPRVVLSCPDSWVGYQRKCYYFSEADGNWTYSQSNCSALGASLAVIDSLQELEFLKYHKVPGIRWIGLRREEKAQPWKWANGAEFNNLFNVTGPSSCAYLNNDGVSSSRCPSDKKWICSMPSLH